MDSLKGFFPISFRYVDDGVCLAIGIILYVLIGIAVGALITVATLLVGWIPGIVGTVIGWVLGSLSSLAGVYVLAGIILQILAFCKVIK